MLNIGTNKQIFLNRWFLAMIAIGSVALACSISAVHVFHLKPCVMCKLQRIPFALLILNSGFGLLSSHKQGFFKVTQVCLALGVVLGMGHFLMQMEALPDFCTSKKGFDTAQEFSRMLKTSKCSDIAWSVFGVPVSLLNAMLHTLVLGLGYRFSLKKGLMGAL